MKKGMIKCGLLVMALSMSSLYPVYSVSAQSETDSHIPTEMISEAHLNFELKAGTSMAIVPSPNLEKVKDHVVYYKFEVKPGEKIIVSYEKYNKETAKWEPIRVKILHESSSEIYYGGYGFANTRFVVTGDRMQEPTTQRIMIEYYY